MKSSEFIIVFISPPKAKIHLLLKVLPVRACLSHHWGCRTIWWEMRKKILILNIHCPCFLCSSKRGMCVLLCLLLACVSLYLVFRVSSLWWLMETCHKLFLVSLQAWKSSFGGLCLESDRISSCWQEFTDMPKRALLFPQFPTTLSHWYQLVQCICLGFFQFTQYLQHPLLFLGDEKADQHLISAYHLKHDLNVIPGLYV